MKKQELKSLSLDTKLRICYTYFKQELPEVAKYIHNLDDYKYNTYMSFKENNADYYNNDYVKFIDDLLYDYINGCFGTP